MKIQLTPRDIAKIAAGLVVAVVLMSGAVYKSRQTQLRQENKRMITQMTREMGLPVIEPSASEEIQTQEEDNQREQASAQQHAAGVR